MNLARNAGALFCCNVGTSKNPVCAYERYNTKLAHCLVRRFGFDGIRMVGRFRSQQMKVSARLQSWHDRSGYRQEREPSPCQPGWCMEDVNRSEMLRQEWVDISVGKDDPGEEENDVQMKRHDPSEG